LTQNFPIEVAWFCFKKLRKQYSDSHKNLAFCLTNWNSFYVHILGLNWISCFVLLLWIFLREFCALVPNFYENILKKIPYFTSSRAGNITVPHNDKPVCLSLPDIKLWSNIVKYRRILLRVTEYLSTWARFIKIILLFRQISIVSI
jgi:hypothetical protein